MTSGIPEVEALEAAIDAAGLHLAVARDGSDGLPGRRRIDLRAATHPLIWISVGDEYDDARAGAPQALLLHLVLAECEAWEAAEDLLAWATDVELDPARSEVRALFDELADVVPRIRAAVGDVRAISSWDFQMNSGAAQALRDASG